MTDAPRLADFLGGAQVDAAVALLRPDYRVLLVAVDGMTPGASDDASERLLVRAESVARDLLADTPVEELPHVAAWREAYRSFGAKPQRTRNSLKALVRRAAAGLPRVNRLTDVYNAISVIHQVPLGGEDLPAYASPPRLVRATGSEVFDTVADGIEVDEQPEPGEVVWRDEVGVTCRRWNWRQCRRTQLTAHNTSAVFILDALAPLSDDALVAAGDELADHLGCLGPAVGVATRLITPAPAPQPLQEHP
jgi:DNA/RNA-binding domain of Phe-tRNA-synthetase-like protein